MAHLRCAHAPAPRAPLRADTRAHALGAEPLRPVAGARGVLSRARENANLSLFSRVLLSRSSLLRGYLTRSFRLAIVSPDRGDNQIKAGCSASGDQPLFTEARCCASSKQATRWSRCVQPVLTPLLLRLAPRRTASWNGS